MQPSATRRHKTVATIPTAPMPSSPATSVPPPLSSLERAAAASSMRCAKTADRGQPVGHKECGVLETKVQPGGGACQHLLGLRLNWAAAGIVVCCPSLSLRQFLQPGVAVEEGTKVHPVLQHRWQH